MAERKVTVWACDRCGTEHRHLNNKGRAPRPKGWTALGDIDLCEACSAGFKVWLKPKNEATVIAENPDGSARLVSVEPS